MPTIGIINDTYSEQGSYNKYMDKGLSVSDRILGMAFGLVRGVLVCMILVALGGMTAAPQQIWWKQAMLAKPLETAVLVTKPWLPDDLAKRIRFS